MYNSPALRVDTPTVFFSPPEHLAGSGCVAVWVLDLPKCLAGSQLNAKAGICRKHVKGQLHSASALVRNANNRKIMLAAIGLRSVRIPNQIAPALEARKYEMRNG